MALWLTCLLAIAKEVSCATKAPYVIKRSAKDLEGQLYEDLLYDYNKIPRPVKNSSDILTVDVGASLIRIIDVVNKVIAFEKEKKRKVKLKREKEKFKMSRRGRR